MATVEVFAGTIRITQAQIKDTRLDNTVCGLVTGVVEQIDTTGLYNQFESYFENKKVEYDSWNAEHMTKFLQWFELIKGLLSEDAAGNLQNEINSINAILREIEESEIDAIVSGIYESDNEGGIEPDIYSRITKEEIEAIVNDAFGKEKLNEISVFE